MKNASGQAPYTALYQSPLGSIVLASDGEYVTALRFEDGAAPADSADLPVFKEAVRWLDTYFGGGIPDFTPPVKPDGTPFQKEVYAILLEIPYGQTTTYGKIAEKIAGRRGVKKMSAQAVGGAVGRNPVALIIPCHRVIGSDGSLAGYAYGLRRKAKLLEAERYARKVLKKR